MSGVNSTRMSMFLLVKTSVPKREVPLSTVADVIRFDAVKRTDSQAKARAALFAGLAAGGDEAESAKGVFKRFKEVTYPLVSFSCKFKGSRSKDTGAFTHTGLYCLDYDGLPDEAAARSIVTTASNDPHVALAWVSPSGLGAKVVVYGNLTPDENEEHKGLVARIASLYDPRYGVAHDTNAVDVSRITYINPDPDLYYNPDAVPLALEEIPDVEDWDGLSEPAPDYDAPEMHGEESEPKDDRWEEASVRERAEGSLKAIERDLCGGPYRMGTNTYGRAASLTWALSQYVEGDAVVCNAWLAKLKGDGRFADKTDERNFLNKWKGTERLTVSAGAWVALVKREAESKGVECPLPKGTRRGNRYTSSPSPDAQRKRRQRGRDEADGMSETAALPEFCRLLPIEKTEGLRVLEFARHRLRRVVAQGGGDYAIICDGDGMWHRLDWRINDMPVAAVKDAVTAARADTIEYVNSMDREDVAKALEKNWASGSMHWKAMANLMSIEACSVYQPVEAVSEADLNRRADHKVIPLAGGGAWCLRENRRLSPADTMPMLLMASGWHIPEPDMAGLLLDGPEIDAMKNVIEGRFAGVFERLAMRLLGPGKTVDVIQVQLSSYGKSTLFEIVKGAFPGSVDVISGKNAFSQQGTKFDALGKKLCGGPWVVFVDECEKGQGEKPLIIGSESVTAVTGTVLSVEEKGKPERSMRRTATPVLLGADWPYFNADAQGMKTRFVWALELPDSIGVMTTEERELLLSPAALTYLRTWMVAKAHELLTKTDNPDEATRTERSNACVAEMMEARTDPWVIALHAKYREAVAGSVSAKDLTAFFESQHEQLGLEVPHANIRGALMRRAFPHAKSKRNAQGIIWRGFEEREQAGVYDDDDDVDDRFPF